MAGVNSRFAIQDEAVPENTKKATKYGLKVLKSVWGFYFADNCQ